MNVADLIAGLQASQAALADHGVVASHVELTEEQYAALRAYAEQNNLLVRDTSRVDSILGMRIVLVDDDA